MPRSPNQVDSNLTKTKRNLSAYCIVKIPISQIQLEGIFFVMIAQCANLTVHSDVFIYLIFLREVGEFLASLSARI